MDAGGLSLMPYSLRPTTPNVFLHVLWHEEFKNAKKKSTGKPIKWTICFSPVLLKVFFVKKLKKINYEKKTDLEFYELPIAETETKSIFDSNSRSSMIFEAKSSSVNFTIDRSSSIDSTKWDK